MFYLCDVGFTFSCVVLCIVSVNPLSPHDALMHHFTFQKTDLSFLQPRVLEWKFPWNWFTNTWQFSLIFKPHEVIFIHYKSRIATAIRGLSWMKMTMVNSGLKGLKQIVLCVSRTQPLNLSLNVITMVKFSGGKTRLSDKKINCTLCGVSQCVYKRHPEKNYLGWWS